MDALSEVLRVVRLTGAVFLSAEFSAPWSLLNAAGPNLCAPYLHNVEHLVHYHLITEGDCSAVLPGCDPVPLEAGDLIVFPHGDEHVLASSPDLEPVPTASLLERVAVNDVHRLAHGGGGTQTRMVCGFLACDAHLCKPLLSALPRILKIRAREARVSSWIETSLRFTLQESAAERTGSSLVLARLAELLFVEAVRRYIDTLPAEQQGWLAGLRDRYVGRALSLMHERPAYPWTVDELARRVALSRSALASRFAQILGQPPMSYLTAWRMNIAAQLVTTTTRSISAISEQTGYDSETAFHRAFKRAFAMAPAAYRRARSDENDAEPLLEQTNERVLPRNDKEYRLPAAGALEPSAICAARSSLERISRSRAYAREPMVDDIVAA